MKHTARIASLLLLLLAMPAWGVEHPGVVPSDADCASCHAKQSQREVGALGHVDFVHGMSCGKNPRGHDDAEPGYAEGTDLLCVPREIRGIAAARARREGTMHGLSRRAQQRPAHVAASGGGPSAFAAENKVKLPFSRTTRLGVRFPSDVQRDLRRGLNASHVPQPRHRPATLRPPGPGRRPHRDRPPLR